MHVTTKDSVQNAEQAEKLGLAIGAHLLSSVLEADGAFELASDKASLSAKVLSVTRTASGGIEVLTAVEVKEPTPDAPIVAEAPKPQPTPQEEAIAYLKGKGFKDKDAEEALEQFGVERILLRRTEELDRKLDDQLSGR